MKSYQLLSVPAAIALGCLGACAARPTPPFNLAPVDTHKVLDVVEWLGSLSDLRHQATVISGLGTVSDSQKVDFVDASGRKAPNYTNYFIIPLSPNTDIGFVYTILYPGGPGATYRGEHVHAEVDLYSRAPSERLCLTASALAGRFGKSMVIGIVTDGGGDDLAWLIGKSAFGYTYLTSAFHDMNRQCAFDLRIEQTTERLRDVLDGSRL